MKIEQENYFLYDDSNMINQTFNTKLNKKIKSYCLISSFNKNTKYYSVLIPHKKNGPRGHAQRGPFPLARKYKIEKSKHWAKILVLKINKKVGQKRQRSYKIVNKIYIGGLQEFDQYTRLNPVDMGKDNDEIISLLTRCKKINIALLSHLSY